jgi:asparaginyl-tRNA synthetase
VTHYDRDTVPFYQKPDRESKNRVLNADLIFPSINGGFGGEIIGSGQRQDDVGEIKESMFRQKVHNVSHYDWYLNLRRDPSYKTTSGFGMGIERFVAWCLGLSSILDAAIYPVVKNEDLFF